MDSASKRQQERAMFQDAGRSRAFLIIRRNLVPFKERSDGMCDLSENPGALSGNPAVAGVPQPPKDWISGHYRRRHSEFLHKQMSRQYVVPKNACSCKAMGAL